MTEQWMGLVEPPSDGIYGYSNGVPITDEWIERDNAAIETESLDVTPRAPGRPRKITPDGVGELVQFRAAPAQVRKLEALAERRRISKADVLREALNNELLAT